MKRTVVTTCILSLFAAAPALAQSDSWPGNVWKQTRKAPAAKKRKPRRKYSGTSRITTGSIKRHAGKKPKRCVQLVSVVGDQAATMDGAKAQAEKAWQQQVRFLNGELYSDPRNAGAISFQCVDSSIRNFANRATEAIGINTQLKRCSMTAEPCRAPKVVGASN